MHELSIVEAMLEQVETEVDRSGETGRITRLDLTIGRLSGVNADSIRFAFQLLSAGTRAEGAELQISEPKPTCVCRTCLARTEVEELVASCPQCGSPDVTLEGGQGLLLDSIELAT